MNCKLKKEEFEYLFNTILKERDSINSHLVISKINEEYLIETTDEILDEIRNWALDELPKKGYNEKYELNNTGKILQSIVDLFYVD